MKAEIKIPNGWRKLERGRTTRVGINPDYWLDIHSMTWKPCILVVTHKADYPVIRKVKKARKP